MLTRLRAVREGDDGMTLMEIMVAMAVSAILAVMAGYFFINTTTSSTAATEQSLQTSQARDALQQWTQLIRVADSPSQAGSGTGRISGAVGPSTLSFYAAVGNRTASTAASSLSLVTLSMANGQLGQTVTDPSGTTTSRVLLGCATTASTGGVRRCSTAGTVVAGRFTPYYGAVGCQATSVTSAGLCVIDPSSPPSTNDVVAIGITFTVDGADGGSHAPARTYSTIVAMGSTT